MTLQDQVISLESAKRLKELGVKQESLFFFMDCTYVGRGFEIKYRLNWDIKESDIPAFTCSELGELLPYRLRLEDDDYWLQISPLKDNVAWDIRYKAYTEIGHQMGYLNYGEFNKGIFQGKNECESRAKMLIHLLEQGLIKI